MECPHKAFDANVQVMRFDDDHAIATVRIICKDCCVPVKFIGLPDGISLETASCSASGVLAHLAFEMYQPEPKHNSKEEDFYGTGKTPDKPTMAQPGSEEKKK